MSDSIYPSIPMLGPDLPTIIPAIEAMRQTLTLMILNGNSPTPNYTPSQAAQIFVTNAILAQAGSMSAHRPVFSSSLVNAANDAAAKTAGVPVNGIYRNGSVLMVRVV